MPREVLDGQIASLLRATAPENSTLRRVFQSMWVLGTVASQELRGDPPLIHLLGHLVTLLKTVPKSWTSTPTRGPYLSHPLMVVAKPEVKICHPLARSSPTALAKPPRTSIMLHSGLLVAKRLKKASFLVTSLAAASWAKTAICKALVLRSLSGAPTARMNPVKVVSPKEKQSLLVPSPLW